MYTIPVIINNRRELYCELIENASNQFLKEFVVEFTQNTYFNLFSIDANAIAKTFIEGNTDLEFKHLKTNCIYSESDAKFIINLNANAASAIPSEKVVPKPKHAFYEDLDDTIEDYNSTAETVGRNKITDVQEFLECSKGIPFLFQIVNNTMQLKAKCNPIISLEQNFDIQFINIELVLQVQQKKYVANFKIHIAHPSEYIGMAIDFGSEASQMVVTKFEPFNGVQLEQPSNENLFQNIKSFHVFNKWIEPTQSEFYQEEQNTNFYKSIFFLKSKLDGDYKNFQTDRYILDQNKNLKMLVDKDSSDDLAHNNFKQLPNLKITHKQDNILSSIHFGYEDSGYMIDVKLNQISQKVSNTILKTMIESYLKKEMIQNKIGNKKVRLIVLVPNIYDSDSVRLVHANVENIFATLATQEAFKDRLKAWEVLAISESDSAFIGYMSKNNVHVHPNKEYIIIDAGKGTTDFSIIKTGNNNIFNVKPVYRNGFAGAGNLITNAIFETVLHFIQEQNAGKPGVQKFIREKIINVLATDLAMRNNFFNELERLKFNFSDNVQCKLQWQQAKSGEIDFGKIIESGSDLKTIIDILSNIERVSDFYGYINEVCEMISEKVVMHLELVKKNMEQIDIAGVVLTGRGFLFAPLALKLQLKLADRLGISLNNMEMLKGNELKDVCIKGVFNKSIRINSEMIGYPIQKIKSIVDANKNVDKKENKNVHTKWWKKLFGSIDDFANFEQNFIVYNKLDYKNLRNSEIIIGSNSYNMDDLEIFDNTNDANVYTTIDYTSGGYKVRRHSNGVVDQIASLHPIIRIDNPDLHMIVPSLFPNYIDEKYLDSLKVELNFVTTNNIVTEGNGLLFGSEVDTNAGLNLKRRDDLLF
jgi:hypothetical protein